MKTKSTYIIAGILVIVAFLGLVIPKIMWILSIAALIALLFTIKGVKNELKSK